MDILKYMYYVDSGNGRSGRRGYRTKQNGVWFKGKEVTGFLPHIRRLRVTS